MALNKCPICSSRVINGVCSECGYDIPDESDISSAYNYNPDDDRFGSTEPVKEIREAAYTMPEISAQPKAPVAYAEPPREYKTPDVKVNTYNPPVQNMNKPSSALKNGGQPVNPYANFSPVENQQNGTTGARFSGQLGKFKKSLSTNNGVGNVNWLSAVIYAVVSFNVPLFGFFVLIKYLTVYLKSKNKGDLVILGVIGAAMLLGVIINVVRYGRLYLGMLN